MDNSAGPYQNYTVAFIGSEAGVVLKVLAKTSQHSLNESVLLEEIDVFNRAKYVRATLPTPVMLSYDLRAPWVLAMLWFRRCIFANCVLLLRLWLMCC